MTLSAPFGVPASTAIHRPAGLKPLPPYPSPAGGVSVARLARETGSKMSALGLSGPATRAIEPCGEIETDCCPLASGRRAWACGVGVVQTRAVPSVLAVA